MKIYNLTKKTIISSDAKFAKSFFDQMFGLLNNNNPRTLIFNTRFGIHTFFLKEEIDLLVLDKNNKVVKLKNNLKPNKLFFWNPKNNIVIELPKSKINLTKTILGDHLKF